MQNDIAGNAAGFRKEPGGVSFIAQTRARNYSGHAGHGLAGRVGEKSIPLLDLSDGLRQEIFRLSPNATRWASGGEKHSSYSIFS